MPAEENNEQPAPVQNEKTRQPGVVEHAAMQDLIFRLFKDVMKPPSWINEPSTRHGAKRMFKKGIKKIFETYCNDHQQIYQGIG